MGTLPLNKEVGLLRVLLRRHNQFATKPRLELFGVLQNRGSFSIKELLGDLPDQNQATLYRNLKLFEQLGVIRKLHMGRQARFELSDIFQHHHHHLTCSNCNRVIILRANPVLEEIIGRLSVKNGFLPTDHQLEIRGLCYSCQQL